MQGNANKTPSGREFEVGVAATAILLSLLIVGIAASNWVWKADFGVPYTGGLILSQGNASKLYDLGEQERVQEALFRRRGLLLDPYPPFHALMFAPLSRLGYRQAYLVWGAINISLWLFFLYLIRDVGVRLQPFRFLMLSSLFFPLWIALVQGQFSILLLVSFALAFVCLKRSRDWAAGLALGLGLLKFQVVLPFALIFLLKRRWRFVAGLTVAATLLIVVSLIIVGLNGMASYLNMLVDTFRHPAGWAYVTIKPSNMPTIRGLFSGLLGADIPQLWITGISMALSGCLILTMAWCWREDEEAVRGTRFDLMFAAAMVVSLATAPYLYPHDLTPALLAVILVVASPQWRVSSCGRLVVTSAIVILYASPFYLIALLARERLFVLAPVLMAFAVAAVWLARQSAQPKGEEGEGRGSQGVGAPGSATV
jgi:Glycosyltransferase family 87